MVVPIVYRKAPTAQVQLTFSEYLLNIGYIRFYGCASRMAAGAISYFLTTTPRDSYPLQTTIAPTTNLEWEIPIKVNMTVAAEDAIINYTLNAGAGSNTMATLTLYHVRGVTVTAIGTEDSGSRIPGAQKYYRECIKMAMTETRFIPGDILRMRVAVVGLPGFSIFHDPGTGTTVVDDLTRTVGTDLTLDLPIKVNN